MKSIPFLLFLTTSVALTKCSKAVKEDFCGDKLMTTIQNFNVFVHSSGVIFYKAKFAIDADGSPRAYGPNDTGLDINENAKNNGKWVGVVTDARGNPIIQKQGDPYPGLYVSQTSLYDTRFADTDPRCYVDAEKIPYIVLPMTLMTLSKADIGDMAYVFNPATKKGSYAIVADEGPEGLLGEGSIYLAKVLGIVNISPRDGGLEGEAIQYIVFPRSGLGNGKHRTIAEIEQVGKLKMEKLGDVASILKCF
jgi:Fungal chitosanase of glycosyl hydrolase group 75